MLGSKKDQPWPKDVEQNKVYFIFDKTILGGQDMSQNCDQTKGEVNFIPGALDVPL